MLKEILEKLKLVSEDDSGVVLTMEELEVLHENFEQLDELSKKTLGSYIKKATDDRIKNELSHDISAKRSISAKHSELSDFHRKRADNFDRISHKRKTGIDKANRKLTKESVDTEALITSIVNSKPSEFMSGFESVMFDKITDLINGKKDELASTLFKESEELQELSRKTLKSFSDKTSENLRKAKDTSPDAEVEKKTHWNAAYGKEARHRIKYSYGFTGAKNGSQARGVPGYYKRQVEAEKSGIKESEDIQELSKKTLGSYIKKATTSSNRSHEKGEKEEDRAMSINANKYPEKFKKHNDAAIKQHDIADRRDTGITLAKSKISGSKERGHWFGPDKKAKILASKKVSEDVEPLEELSKDTLMSYIVKSTAKRDFQTKMAKKWKKDSEKTTRGRNLAFKKIMKKDVE